MRARVVRWRMHHTSLDDLDSAAGEAEALETPLARSCAKGATLSAGRVIPVPKAVSASGFID